MQSDHLSVYITTNREGGESYLSFSQARVKALAYLGIVIVILLIAILFDYAHLIGQKTIFNDVSIENSKLKERLVVIEGQLNTLEESLGKLKDVSKKVELISNAADEAVLSKLAESSPVTLKASQRLTGALNESAVEPVFITKESPLMFEAPLAGDSELDQFYFLPLAERIEVAALDTILMEQKVLHLWETLSERQNFLRATPSIKPANGWYSSRFGYRLDPFTRRPTMHNGLDIAARQGTPVFSSADGIVSHVGRKSGYGNLVIIDHGYGVETRYGHNSKLYVTKGQPVKRYDVIAAVGNTGRSTSSHLHYEVRVRGVPVDPMNYILDFE